MDEEIVYIDKNGKRSKKPPEGIPPFIPKPLIDGEGCSPENGILVKPELDGKVRKRAKKR